MAPFSKPETVLKQAEGLVSVGQTHAALQSLTEMFQSKRFRSTPLISLEPIMLRFVELCVEMRKGRTAKEGLMQYKNIAQNTSVASIEVVVNRFIQLSDAKVQDAQEKAEKAVALTDVDDLEAMETPESILLGAVSGDQNKDRTDRALVTPWLKFLWESYRTALETLKNNARLEGIYQQIAQQAFKFCLKHQRKVEFRRLCETLRLHLANVAKYAHQPHAINLSDPDTLQHHLDTRFAQLNASVELELWQEAFRSVEDVHNLLTMAKKAPRPAMMANYYEKLTKIFLMSGNALYHAAAWGRYYAIVTTTGGKPEEEMIRLAGQVLVSALAVPVGQQADEGVPMEEGRGKNSRLTALLGLSKVPTRAGLLKDALSRNVHKISPDTIKSLYNILEVTFDPLTLCTSVAPLLHTLSQDSSYSQYLPLLQSALLSRLLSQLSQVYSSIKVSNLLDLLAPLREAGFSGDGTYDEERVEAYVMGCARRGELSVRVDHSSGSITFVDDPFVSVDDPSSSTSAPSRETPIQPSTADLVRTRLSSLAVCLHNSLALLYPPTPLSEEEQQTKFSSLVSAANAERRALQIRRSLVVRRRELISELSLRKDKEEASRKAELSRREKEEEVKRTLEAARKREVEKARKEIESIRTEEARKLAQSLNERGNIKVDINDMENISTDTLVRMHVEQLEREKRELAQRMHVIGKRLDHVERAYRKEERPLLAKDYEFQQENDKTTFEAIQKARVENSKITHQKDLETKRRLLRMMDDHNAYRGTVLAQRSREFAKKREEAQKIIEEKKKTRLQSILKTREEERKRREEEERLRREQEEETARLEAERIAEEERIRAEAEAEAAAAEAEKKEEEEKAAALRKQRAEEREAAANAAKLQRQREEEAEARRAARHAEQLAPKTADSGAGAWRRPTPSNPTPVPARVSTPPRSESPAPAAGTPKYRPRALRDPPPDRSASPAPAKEGAWVPRSRVDSTREDDSGSKAWRPSRMTDETAKKEDVWRPSRPREEQPLARDDPKPREEAPAKDPEGFQTVEKKSGVWRPKRGRA